MKDISRRNFLQGTGIALAGAAAFGALTGCSPSKTGEEAAEETAETVAIAATAAGEQEQDPDDAAAVVAVIVETVHNVPSFLDRCIFGSCFASHTVSYAGKEKW